MGLRLVFMFTVLSFMCHLTYVSLLATRRFLLAASDHLVFPALHTIFYIIVTNIL